MKSYYIQRISEEESQLEQLKTKVNQVSNIRLAILIGAAVLFYFLLNTNPFIALGFFAAFILSFYYLVKYHEKQEEKVLIKLALLEVLKNERNCLEGLNNQYDNGETYSIRNHPFAEDLDLFGEGSLYSLINRSTTLKGKESLANAFLIGFKTTDQENKQETVNEIKENTDFKENFKAALWNDIKSKGDFSQNLIELKEPPAIPGEKLIGFYSKFLPFVWLLLIVLAYFSDLTWVGTAAVLIILTNFAISGINNKDVNAWFSSLEGIGNKTLKYGHAIDIIQAQDWKSGNLNELLNKLPESKDKNPLHDFAFFLRKLQMKKNAFASVFLYIYSPFDIVQVINLRKWYNEHPEFFEQIFEVLGGFEYYNSLATLQFNHPEWSFPVFENNTGIKIAAIELGHPLIPANQVVCNSFELNNSNRLSLITGSNMSGKSTFLRSIGTNIILAYIGAPVFAKNLKLEKGIELISYMRIKDDLQQNASTFKSEINRLKLIVEAISADGNTLFLIDEMLRGTNSEDKLKGSMALLHKVIASKTYAYVATHDLRITDISTEHPECVKNYFFEYQSTNGELSFDYKIKEGVCHSFNASLLLEQIGLNMKS